MLPRIAQTFHDQASMAMFVPGFMAACCHAKPLLAMPRPRSHHQPLGQAIARVCSAKLPFEDYLSFVHKKLKH